LQSCRIAPSADTIATQSSIALRQPGKIVLTNATSALDVFCRAPELRLQLRQIAILRKPIPLASLSEPAQHRTAGLGPK
jgi:hypothetical protein